MSEAPANQPHDAAFAPSAPSAVAKLSRPYRVAARVSVTALIVVIVAVLMFLYHRLPVLEDVIGGGGVPCMSPAATCSPDLSPTIPAPTSAPRTSADPR